MAERFPPVMINMSTIPVDGIGGLGLVAVVGVMAVAFPEARLILGGGFVGGIAIALAMIALRRRTRADGAGGGTSILFGERVVTPSGRPDQPQCPRQTAGPSRARGGRSLRPDSVILS